MNNDTEKMIASLSVEIERKCDHIKKAQREKRMTRLFVVMCIAAILVPTLFVFCGLNLITLIVPVIFLAIAFLLLSPIIINQQGGHTYEQV